MKRRALVIAGLLAALGCLQASLAKQRHFTDHQTPAIVSPQGPRIHTDFGKIPLQFLPNKGQVDSPAVFYVPGKDKTIYFAAEGLTFVLHGQRESTPERWVVKLDFVGSDPEAIPTSAEESGAVISYFKGKPDAWKTGLSASSRIIYRELWPGVDLVYQGTFDRLKYEFVVRPGADPARIRLAVRGAETFGLTADGRLTVQTPAGGFEDDAPVAYQEIGGVRREVPVSYDLNAKRYGFSVGGYDGGRTLVIDPSSLVYCGFIGGGSEDQGKAISLDSGGCAYVTGWTESQSSFPVVVGPDYTPNGSFPDLDAFVAKVDAAGAALVYCGFIGGSGSDIGYGIAVDSGGNAYVAGTTLSSQPSFPVLIGPDVTYNGGNFYGDAFVAKVDASGASLDYCGYVGGGMDDLASAIAVDAAGSAYVTGTTQSSEVNFPVAVGPDLSFNIGSDAFVAKVVPSGATLAYCGYIGANGGESGYGIAIDTAGCAYVTGSVYPLLDNQGQPLLPVFPTVVGPDLTWNGESDAFVAKVASNGSSLLYCGYIGGSSSDRCRGIAVDSAGCAYVTGETLSTEATFPVKVGPGLTYHPRITSSGSGYDAFLAKVDTSGSNLIYCGYIGGSEDDFGYGIAIDAAGNAYVTGETDAAQSSGLSTFPVLNWPYRKANGMDAFVTKVRPSGAGLDYSGFIGGGGTDGGRGIAVDAAGCAYITGNTNSHDLPTVVGPDLIWHISDDVLVAKVPANPIIYGPEITSLSPPSISAYDPDFTLTVFGTGFLEGALVNFNYETVPETEYISGTELRAPVRGNFFAGAAIPVVVYNPGVEVSHEALFYVNNPVPVLDSVEPAYLSGGYDSSIHVKGSNFVNTSRAYFNGQDLGNNLSSIGEGWAVVPYWQLSQSGNASVTVFNPPPEGGSSNALTIPVTGYALGASPDSVTIQAGQRAVYTIQVTPQLGPFDNQIKFACGDLPRGCAASFNPARLTPGASPGTTTLTLTTKADTGSAAGTLAGTAPLGPPAAGLLFLLLALWLRAFARGLSALPPRRRWVLAGAALFLFLTVSGCGTGGGDDKQHVPGTPKGTHTVTVNATSGTMTVSKTLTMVVQ
jgi:hypothetical protein